MNEWDDPEISLLVKLGSLIVHAQEALGPHGTLFDSQAFYSGLEDPGVKGWLAGGIEQGLLPLPRNWQEGGL